MTQDKAILKWKESATDDLDTAQILFVSKKYVYCLFFCHLALEKMLKSLCILQMNDAPPITHDLLKLALTAKLTLTSIQENNLREITTFNIEARYDIYKQRLYKKATEEFTSSYLALTRELFLWIEQHLKH